MTLALPRWSHLRLRTKGLIVVSVAVLPMVVFWITIGVLLLRRDPVVAVNTPARAREVQIASTRLQLAIAEAMRAARDSASGTVEARSRLDAARAQVTPQLKTLEALVVDAEAVGSLRVIREEALAIDDLLDGVIAAPVDSRQIDALYQALPTRWSRLRAAAAALDARQQAIADERTATLRQPRRLAALALLGTLLCVPAGYAAAILLARGTRRRLSLLEENAGRLARGETLTPMPEGADEIAQLGAHLEETAARLEAREAALRQRTAELEASNRELEAFSYSVSHDLRAPLRAIDGFSRAVEEDHGPTLDPDAAASLRRVRAAAARMATLIDELLNLSRISRTDVHREPIDLSALAAGIVAERQQHGGAPAPVTIAPDLHTHADPRLVRIALQNLLDNAWKYSSKRDRPRIEVGQVNGRDPAVFYVRDNGAGFDMAHAGKLFGPFQRLHAERDFPGTGIGLATVQRVARKHGGRVWADSAVDAGATFYFTLDSDPSTSDGAP